MRRYFNLNYFKSVVDSAAKLEFILFAQCRVAIFLWESTHGFEVKYPIPTEINAARIIAGNIFDGRIHDEKLYSPLDIYKAELEQSNYIGTFYALNEIPIRLRQFIRLPTSLPTATQPQSTNTKTGTPTAARKILQLTGPEKEMLSTSGDDEKPSYSVDANISQYPHPKFQATGAKNPLGLSVYATHIDAVGKPRVVNGTTYRLRELTSYHWHPIR